MLTSLKRNHSLIILIAALLLGILTTIFYFNTQPSPTSPKTLTESQAIDLIKQQHPELNDYPNQDKLPPTDIKAERSSQGWHLAFIQLGSGIPILEAQCYLVDASNKIARTGQYKNSGEIKQTISPQTCQ